MLFPILTNFDKLISRGYCYFDRTDRIAVMESVGDQLLFLRPRRFGKSLWLSTLINYYDIAKADDFDRLFGQLAVGFERLLWEEVPPTNSNLRQPPHNIHRLQAYSNYFTNEP